MKCSATRACAVGTQLIGTLTGTCSHFCCNHLGDRKRKLSCPLPPQCLLGHDRSKKTMGPFTKRSASRACAVGTRL
ncbi:unnamed protein product [Staurois parvus]|uniref:Secreted protein n=1 Tax=Staurois parvus TaxID=386267 RepID=A0ABN9BQA6_9NEOB|nr:unnamed protein product [Staurois parvus]